MLGVMARVLVRVGSFRDFRPVSSGPCAIPVTTTSRVAIYACFCNSAREEDEVRAVVEEVAKVVDILIVVNTGSAHLRINPASATVQVASRENKGRDLGSYRFGIDMLSSVEVAELSLLNDSVYWLPGAATAFISAARGTAWDVTGLTESRQTRRHLQSFALHIKVPKLAALEPITAVRDWRWKRMLVAAGEIEFSHKWVRRGISIGALHTQDSLWQQAVQSLRASYLSDFDEVQTLVEREVALNPSIHLWPSLLQQAGVLKKSLLRENPCRFKEPPTTLAEAQSRV